MSLDSEFYLYGILLPSGALLSEVTDTNTAANTEELVGYAAGHAHPLFRGVRGQKPDCTFTHSAVGQVLAAIVAGGNNYCLDLSAGNTDIEYRQGQNLGIRFATTTSAHERLRMARGFLYWNSVGAAHQQDADIQCRLLGVYDGDNAPLVQVGTGTLTGTSAATQFYTMGPVKINGSWLGNELEWRLSSGVEPRELGCGGEIYDRYAGVRQTNPVLSITCTSKPWGGLDLTGTAITSLDFYLRAKDADNQNEADTTEAHIKITATNGLILPEATTGGMNDPASNTLRVGLRAPGSTSNVLTIDTSAAIA